MGATVNSGRVTADISGSVVTTNAPAVADFVNTKVVQRQSAGTTTTTVPASHVYVITSAVCAYAQDASIFFATGGASGITIASSVATTRFSTGTWTGAVKLIAGDTFAISGYGVVTYEDFTV